MDVSGQRRQAGHDRIVKQVRPDALNRRRVNGRGFQSNHGRTAFGTRDHISVQPRPNPAPSIAQTHVMAAHHHTVLQLNGPKRQRLE